MKLASLKSGRDGRLVVVSDDLAWCAAPPPMYPTLQSVLDDWDHAAPVLEGVALSLSHDAVPHARFHERDAAAPLPRAYQWADGSAHGHHDQPMQRTDGAAAPAAGRHDPLIQQFASDHVLPPRDPIPCRDPARGLDLEAEVVVVTGDVPRGASREQALAAIRLVGLASCTVLPEQVTKGLAHARLDSALSPVLVTPAALGDRWQDGRLVGTLSVNRNGQPLGRVETLAAMTFDFGTLIAHLARSRSIGAGSIIGSGSIANRAGGGAPAAWQLKPGDVVRVEMLDDHHHAIFGAIEQVVASA